MLHLCSAAFVLYLLFPVICSLTEPGLQLLLSHCLFHLRGKELKGKEYCCIGLVVIDTKFFVQQSLLLSGHYGKENACLHTQQLIGNQNRTTKHWCVVNKTCFFLRRRHILLPLCKKKKITQDANIVISRRFNLTQNWQCFPYKAKHRSYVSHSSTSFQFHPSNDVVFDRNTVVIIKTKVFLWLCLLLQKKEKNVFQHQSDTNF